MTKCKNLQEVGARGHGSLSLNEWDRVCGLWMFLEDVSILSDVWFKILKRVVGKVWETI